jgi:hypothetical protein
MMAQKKTKDTYAVYKTEGRALKNKIRKMERHCKRFPNDLVGKENLERIKKGNYKPRSKPLSPGSNPTIPKIRLSNEIGHMYGPKTAGEQLSALLGIPMPQARTYKKNKPKVTHKQRRNVKA